MYHSVVAQNLKIVDDLIFINEKLMIIYFGYLLLFKK
jgi:hypothetical protein